MKKLMMAAAIVCAAVIAQAGQIQWGSMYLNVAGQAGDEADIIDGATVYLMAGNSSTIFASLVADFDTAVAGAVSSANQFDLGLSAPSVGTVNANDQIMIDADAASTTLFMVMKDGDNLYISESLTGTVPATGSKAFEFSHDAAYEGTFFASADSFQGAGWYNTAAIPEPTSGLLLLLGFAGLALKRKQA